LGLAWQRVDISADSKWLRAETATPDIRYVDMKNGEAMPLAEGREKLGKLDVKWATAGVR
jgi:hypothetical protein